MRMNSAFPLPHLFFFFMYLFLQQRVNPFSSQSQYNSIFHNKSDHCNTDLSEFYWISQVSKHICFSGTKIFIVIFLCGFLILQLSSSWLFGLICGFEGANSGIQNFIQILINNDDKNIVLSYSSLTKITPCAYIY